MAGFDVDKDPYEGMTEAQIEEARIQNELRLLAISRKTRQLSPGRAVRGSRKFAVSVMLDQDSVDLFEQLGDGNLSAGARKAAEIVRSLHADGKAD